MLQEYINERYPELSHMSDQAEELYKAAGFNIASYFYGFFTWKACGDALIIGDIFTSKQWRPHRYAWSLFYDIKRLAKDLDKHVIIGLTEPNGVNQYLGVVAMKASKFKQAYESPKLVIWIRGVN